MSLSNIAENELAYVDVERLKINTAQAAVMAHRPQYCNLDSAGILLMELFKAIIRSLFGNDDVVHMALTKPGAGDPHKTTFSLKLLDGGAPAIAHS